LARPRCARSRWQLVLEKLKELDPLAYIRYAIVYMEWRRGKLAGELDRLRTNGADADRRRTQLITGTGRRAAEEQRATQREIRHVWQRMKKFPPAIPPRENTLSENACRYCTSATCARLTASLVRRRRHVPRSPVPWPTRRGVRLRRAPPPRIASTGCWPAAFFPNSPTSPARHAAGQLAPVSCADHRRSRQTRRCIFSTSVTPP